MPRRREPVHFHQLSEFEKGHIVGMREPDFSIRQISNRIDRSVSTVLQCWRRWSEEGVDERIRGSGRPQRMSTRENSHLRITALRDRRSTTRAIATDWMGALDLHVISLSPNKVVWVAFISTISLPPIDTETSCS